MTNIIYPHRNSGLEKLTVLTSNRHSPTRPASTTDHNKEEYEEYEEYKEGINARSNSETKERNINKGLRERYKINIRWKKDPNPYDNLLWVRKQANKAYRNTGTLGHRILTREGIHTVRDTYGKGY